MKCYIFFSPYVLLLPNSVLASLGIVFFPQKFCVVYLNLTGYQIKA